MNFFKSNRILFALLLIVLSSCAIHKRQHLSGYYIDWNFSRNKSEHIIKNQTSLSKIESIDSIDSTCFVSEIYSENENLYASNNENIEDVNPIDKYKQVITNNSYNIDLHHKNTTNEIPDKKEKNYGRISMFFAILNLLLCVSIVIPIILSIDFLLVFYLLLLPFISIALSFLGLFYGIRELAEFSQNKQRKVMAVLGIIVSLIPLIFFIMYLALAFLIIIAQID